MQLNELTIKAANEGLKNKEFSSVDLTNACLDQIKKTDDKIKAFITVTGDIALEQAEAVDKKGDFSNPLAGIPVGIKDIFCTKDVKTTAASKILENYVPPFSATAVDKLEAQNAVMLGKTNLDEFAMGSSTENSGFFPTKNPWDLERVPGGSSGGSAAAVAADQCFYALGTDTGGSIREPASFCGITGLKVTYGRVSRYGVMSYASSFDTIGPLTKTVEDAEIVFRAISGKDKMDATSTDYAYEKLDVGMKDLKIGVPKEYFAKGLDPEVEKIIRNVIKKAEDAGAKIQEVSLPSTEYALACYYIIGPSEISANLARLDGIRYGLSEGKKDLLDVYLKSRGHGFGAEVKRRIMIGTYCLSSGYYDAYYKKAQEVRQLVRRDFASVFGTVDLLFCPVSPFPAFKLGEKADDPLSMYLADIYTIPSKLAGLPGLSLPVGKTGDLPVGLQIIGNHFQENKILSIATELEKTVDNNS